MPWRSMKFNGTATACHESSWDCHGMPWQCHAWWSLRLPWHAAMKISKYVDFVFNHAGVMVHAVPRVMGAWPQY